MSVNTLPTSTEPRWLYLERLDPLQCLNSYKPNTPDRQASWTAVRHRMAMASMVELLADPIWSAITEPIRSLIDQKSFADCLWSTDPEKTARWRSVLSRLESAREACPAGLDDYAQMRMGAAIGSLLWFDRRLKENGNPSADCSNTQESLVSADYTGIAGSRATSSHSRDIESSQADKLFEPIRPTWDSRVDVAQILGIHEIPQSDIDIDTDTDSSNLEN